MIISLNNNTRTLNLSKIKVKSGKNKLYVN
jgi:hypothetical protein